MNCAHIFIRFKKEFELTQFFPELIKFSQRLGHFNAKFFYSYFYVDLVEVFLSRNKINKIKPQNKFFRSDIPIHLRRANKKNGFSHMSTKNEQKIILLNANEQEKIIFLWKREKSAKTFSLHILGRTSASIHESYHSKLTNKRQKTCFFKNKK